MSKVDELIGLFNALEPADKALFLRKFLVGVIQPLRGEKLHRRVNYLIDLIVEGTIRTGISLAEFEVLVRAIQNEREIGTVFERVSARVGTNLPN